MVNRRLKIFFGLKLRYVLASFILLIVILIAAGYFSVRAGRKATLAGIVQQGRALTTVLVASASNIITTDRQITDIAVDEIVSEIELTIASQVYENEPDFLETLVAKLGLIRASIYDRGKSVIHKMETEPRNISGILDSLQTYFLENVQIDQPFDIIYDFYFIQDRRFLFGLLPYKGDTFILIVYPWTVGQYADRKLSLAYLLNQLSLEVGVEYIVLQNYDGIVFASKQVSQMDRIEDDPFLAKALEADSALYRTVSFQDRKVLEVVQTFNSGGEFFGLFRVGLSLYGYRQLTANFQKQVWLFVILLVVLGIVGFGIFAGYQNLSIMESALGRARAISRSLHDSIAGIVLSTDEKLQIITANVSARKNFGLPDGEPKTWSYDHYFPGDPFMVKSVLKEKKSKSFETQIIGSSGPMNLLVSTNPLFNAEGKPTGVIVVAHDISRRRALERQAQQAQRLSELGTVAAGLAHEIRNPLNSIGMIIQRLGSEIKVESGREEFDEFLATLNSEHRNLDMIVEKILQVAKSGKLEFQEANIKQVIEEVVSLYKYEASARSIEIKTKVANGKVRIDKEAIKGVLSNLIKNAIEAIGENGHIEVSTMFEFDGSGNDVRRMVLVVSDDGPGISDQQQRNLFKPFYTDKPGGTGLGLATAHRIAVDHGGDLRVESKIGGPTKFILTIPVMR